VIAENAQKLAVTDQASRPSAPIENPKPGGEAKAIITLKNGKTVKADATQISTDSWCGEGSGLTFDYGQSIPFKNMQSFSVIDDKPTVKVIVIKGDQLTAVLNANCGIYAVNEYGRFQARISNIERVDFGR
jgi:hypothetical protein